MPSYKISPLKLRGRYVNSPTVRQNSDSNSNSCWRTTGRFKHACNSQNLSCVILWLQAQAHLASNETSSGGLANSPAVTTLMALVNQPAAAEAVLACTIRSSAESTAAQPNGRVLELSNMFAILLRQGPVRFGMTTLPTAHREFRVRFPRPLTASCSCWRMYYCSLWSTRSTNSPIPVGLCVVALLPISCTACAR